MKEKDSPSSHRPLGVLIFVLYVFWGFFLFLLGLYLFFPREQLRSRIEQELSLEKGPQSPPWATGFGVEIGDLDIHLLRPGVHLQNIRFTVKSAKEKSGKLETSSPKQPERVLIVQSFDIYLSWWDVLLGQLPPPKVQAELQAFGGQISLQLEQESSASDGSKPSKDERTLYQISLKSTKLQLSDLAKGFTSVPIAGSLEINATLTLPTDAKTKHAYIQKLDGSIQFNLDGVAVGDGKQSFPIEALPTDAQQLLGPKLTQVSPGGIPIPKIVLGQMKSRIRFQKEKALLEGFQFQGPAVPSLPGNNRTVPLQLMMDGSVALQDNMDLSSISVYLRIGPWKPLFDRVLDLMKDARDPAKDAAIIKQIDEELRPLSDLVQMKERADGFLGFSVNGPFKKPSIVLQANNPDHIVLQPTNK